MAGGRRSGTRRVSARRGGEVREEELLLFANESKNIPN